MFNKDNLAKLIKKAQGNRSLNQFALHCNLNAGNLSRILNKKNIQPPKPESLKKIAKHSYNNVTYEDLMIASGHIIDNSSHNNLHELSIENQKDIGEMLDVIKNNLIENKDNLILYGESLAPEAVQCILETLEFSIKQTKILNKICNSRI